jgi:hypothetical protein
VGFGCVSQGLKALDKNPKSTPLGGGFLTRPFKPYASFEPYESHKTPTPILAIVGLRAVLGCSRLASITVRG